MSNLKVEFGCHHCLAEGDRLVISVIQRQGSYNKEVVSFQKIFFDGDVGSLVFDTVELTNHPQITIDETRVTRG